MANILTTLASNTTAPVVQQELAKTAIARNDKNILRLLAGAPVLDPQVDTLLAEVADAKVVAAWISRPGRNLKAVTERARTEADTKARISVLEAIAGISELEPAAYDAVLNANVSANGKLKIAATCLANSSLTDEQISKALNTILSTNLTHRGRTTYEIREIIDENEDLVPVLWNLLDTCPADKFVRYWQNAMTYSTRITHILPSPPQAGRILTRPDWYSGQLTDKRQYYIQASTSEARFALLKALMYKDEKSPVNDSLRKTLFDKHAAELTVVGNYPGLANLYNNRDQETYRIRSSYTELYLTQLDTTDEEEFTTTVNALLTGNRIAFVVVEKLWTHPLLDTQTRIKLVKHLYNQRQYRSVSALVGLNPTDSVSVGVIGAFSNHWMVGFNDKTIRATDDPTLTLWAAFQTGISLHRLNESLVNSLANFLNTPGVNVDRLVGMIPLTVLDSPYCPKQLAAAATKRFETLDRKSWEQVFALTPTFTGTLDDLFSTITMITGI